MKKLLIFFFVLSAAACSRESCRVSRAGAIAAEMRNPESRYVVVACHRGDWRNFPENSIPAIESVIAMGADVMELDLRMTKDSVLVLSHDADVLRCTNFRSVFKDEPDKSPLVKDLTYEDICRLRLKRAHGVATDTICMPTLKQALAVCKDRICVNVDKGFQYYEQVLSIADELGVTDQILIKSKYPIEKVAEVFSAHGGNMMYMPVVDIQKPAGKALYESYRKHGTVPIAYELCWSESDGTFEKVAAEVIESGAKVWVNTIWASLCGGIGHDDDEAFLHEDKGEVYQFYLDNGVSMIQTDRPRQLIDFLTGAGRHTLKY